jgi:hypothetical protein
MLSGLTLSAERLPIQTVTFDRQGEEDATQATLAAEV